MPPKRKAPSSPTDESPSKRVTRSKGSTLALSLPQTTPRKSRIAKRSVPDCSDDELDLLGQVPTTPSKKPKKKVSIAVSPSGHTLKPVEEPQASPSKKPRFVYGKRRDDNGGSPKKNVQLKTPSLTPPPVLRPIASPQRSPSRHVTNGILSEALHDSLVCQKRAVLHALQHPSSFVPEDTDEYSTNEIAVKQLGDLLEGTVSRGEGNSCLLLGPRGSGKTRVCRSFMKYALILNSIAGNRVLYFQLRRSPHRYSTIRLGSD